MSHRINVEDKTNLCATPRFLAHIEFKVLWKLILTAIEKQDFIFSAGGLAINFE